MNEINLEADAVTTGTDEEMSAVSVHANRALELQNEISSMEEALREQKQKLDGILRFELPEAMENAGLSEFKTSTGAKVTIKEVVSASIPVRDTDKREAAFGWLRENGHGSLIKNEWKILMGADQTDSANLELVDKLMDAGATQKVSVHSRTLTAFCKEQMAAGKELPADLLGLFVGRIAKLETE